jgi:hypothetical protein
MDVLQAGDHADPPGLIRDAVLEDSKMPDALRARLAASP